jgi:hypothetical protein
VALDHQTRARLLEARLAGVVKTRDGQPGEPESIRGGAGVVGPDGTSWVLVQDEPARGVGMALAWASRHGAATTTLVVDVDAHGRPQDAAAALAARKGAVLRVPVPVWWIEGRDVHDAVPPPAQPRGPHIPAEAAVPWLDAARAAGLDVSVLADGSVSFEVLGLEVGRATAAGVLQVGAGRHDREATEEVWAGEPGREALVRAAEAVRIERRADRIPTQASTLQRERWLRRALVADPSPLGLETLLVLPDAAPAADLRRPRPAGAVTPDGSVLVVCSAGADLDLIPTAADLRASHVPDATRIVLVVPPGDDHPITRDLLAHLPVPAELVTVPPPWA